MSRSLSGYLPRHMELIILKTVRKERTAKKDLQNPLEQVYVSQDTTAHQKACTPRLPLWGILHLVWGPWHQLCVFLARTHLLWARSFVLCVLQVILVTDTARTFLAYVQLVRTECRWTLLGVCCVRQELSPSKLAHPTSRTASPVLKGEYAAFRA